jgi:hypothetical protein
MMNGRNQFQMLMMGQWMIQLSQSRKTSLVYYLVTNHHSHHPVTTTRLLHLSWNQHSYHPALQRELLLSWMRLPLTTLWHGVAQPLIHKWNNKKSILRLYPTRPYAQERHHLPNSGGTRLLLYYVQVDSTVSDYINALEAESQGVYKTCLMECQRRFVDDHKRVQEEGRPVQVFSPPPLTDW